MSEIYVARTNQKLSFARCHIDALSQAQGSSSWNKHGIIESYNESVLFHLKGAIHAFVREIGERYRLDVSTIDDIAGLQAQFETTGQESPELNELEQLSVTPGSWLEKLERAYSACWRASAQRSKPQDASQSLSEIHVVQVNPDHAEDLELLSEFRQWFDELNKLVDRQRGSMLEW
ncbi:hypothetical protein ADIMK_3281 [Marinobacterium lacunae]|uniref:Uncharacterized protein n=1 Tax=Marinobacterium lacunae TaxID=1232683 RepID=A0A081FWA4_9GAMM|nr:DUF6586 family protein [Marinobacterium lacunae]KEA62809.1 hypothetical protein ADIMK_3281 [Marinobacterium lacunae]MBR9885306.1 hypothetical protein [Oceanospirillales bacterium]